MKTWIYTYIHINYFNTSRFLKHLKSIIAPTILELMFVGLG